MAFTTLAEGLELVFVVDVCLFCFGTVRVRDKMPGIRIIAVIISVNIPNDVKAKLTQILLYKE
eukprot:215768-Ditylum_brightwellii.AAC.1